MVGLGGAGAAVIVWASNLTMLQRLTEPAKPWRDEWAENNTYWARDLRWTVLVAVVAGLVLAFRGDRWRSAGAWLAVGGLIGVDLAVDRYDLAGLPAAGWLSAAVCALLFLGWLLTRPGSAPDRVSLILAASVAAATAPLAAGIESPSETDPAALDAAALVTGVLLVVMAFGCAVAAAPRRSPRRLAVAGAAAVAASGAVALRVVETGPQILLYVAAGGLLLAGVAAVVCPWKPGTAIAAIGMLVGHPVLSTALLLFFAIGWPLGPEFTRIAGNPPVNAADTDLIIVPVGILSGLILGALLAAISRVGQPVDTPRTEEPATV
ncbi:hypothetical protein Vau01_109850 [Virgisporangium aurantiacum]|uniref:Uncharacterized protein n=1 Tax=Virgisporangium aurantiacum TaxID=175570 RepID=A0A8J3ZG16_9ACTN|nr:hypothetical protein Vau01_109850 [Virgisporangium aurantiacum]